MAKGTLRNPSRVMKRALKSTSKDEGRKILGCVHLDGCGTVVSTDSYAMYVEHRAYEGEGIDVPQGLARQIAKLPVAVDRVEIEDDGHTVTATTPDGKAMHADADGGRFPDWKRLLDMVGDPTSTARVAPKPLSPILAEHGRFKGRRVKLAFRRGSLFVEGDDPDEYEPSYRADGACEGADFTTAFDPALLDRSLKQAAGGGAATVCATEAHKPIWITGEALDGGVMLMPCRLYNTEALRSPLARREQDAGDLAERIAERSPEARALMDAGKVVVVDMTEERGAKARVVKGADGKAKAVVVEEHHDIAERGEEEGERDMEGKRIEELEAELKQMREELEQVWKENETLKAAQKPQEAAAAPKQVKRAPKPRKAPCAPTAAAEAVERASVEVTLKFMEQWAAERGLLATQKREGCCIWVEGESRPYAAELKELGFKFTGKRKSWYLDPKHAKSAA